MVCGLAEGRRRGGGRAKIIEKRFENLVILNGMWIGGGAAKGRRQVFGEVLGFPAEGRRRGGGGAERQRSLHLAVGGYIFGVENFICVVS